MSIDFLGAKAKDIVPKLLQLDSTGEILDASGNPLPGIRHKNFIEVGSGTAVKFFDAFQGTGLAAVSAFRGANDATALFTINYFQPAGYVLTQLSSYYEAGGGTPNGSTGTSGKVTLFIDAAGDIYIENRRSTDEQYSVTILGVEL